MTGDPIHRCIERWHQHLRGGLEGGLDAILHEDCTFVSPIVFSPQHGRELTKLYLFVGRGGTKWDRLPFPGWSVPEIEILAP